MKLYKEWARQVNKRQGLMVDLPTLANICKSYNPGYASVYMFEESDALEIKERRSSRGMDRYKVWAEALTIDLDGGESQLRETETRLATKGLAYEVWSSGGKGFHVAIPHTLVGSVYLPYSHKKAVEALGVPHDPTLYQHGRLISLPGRVHPKTGNKKKYIKSVTGNRLVLELVEKPEPTFNFAPNGGLGTLQAGLHKLLDLALQEPQLGMRHTRMFAVANDLTSAGISPEAVRELLVAVNDLWDNPKTEDEIISAIEGGMRWQGGG